MRFHAHSILVLGIPTIIAVTREGNQIRVEWQKVVSINRVPL